MAQVISSRRHIFWHWIFYELEGTCIDGLLRVRVHTGSICPTTFQIIKEVVFHWIINLELVCSEVLMISLNLYTVSRRSLISCYLEYVYRNEIKINMGRPKKLYRS